MTFYATNLVPTSLPEFFELNGYRSTYDILPSIAAPSFQLGLTSDPIAGTVGSGIVLLDIASARATQINLTVSDSAIQIPATVTVPAGQLSQTFRFTIGSSFNSNHVFAITAQSGTTSAIAYDTVVPLGGAGFQAALGIPLTYPDVNMAAGQTVNDLSVGITSVNGYTTTVGMQCLGLPMQSTCQFSPATLPLRAGDINNGGMAISVADGTAQGTYPAKVRVTNGLITRDLPFTLNVGDFAMGIGSPTLQAQSTGSANFAITLTSIFDYGQYVNFSCSELPQGASCPASLEFTGLPTIYGSSYTFGITTQSVPAGNYPFTITGTSARSRTRLTQRYRLRISAPRSPLPVQPLRPDSRHRSRLLYPP